MCDIDECLTAGDIETVLVQDSVTLKVGYINGFPFSALIVDNRSGMHLHFPWDDVARFMQRGGRKWRRLEHSFGRVKT